LGALQYDVPAATASIDRVCREVDVWLGETGLKRERFAVAMLLREGLNNAVLHGRPGSSPGRMRCCIRSGRKWVQIEIEDDGSGFDWRSRMARQAAGIGECHGRGLQIYKLYADEVGFNRRGNRVRLRRRIQRGALHVDGSDSAA
jgi:serine/threonine-protein kinase RsbW